MAQVFHNPTPDELRAFTEEMPEARISGVRQRQRPDEGPLPLGRLTYVVDRESSGKTMTRADYDTIAAPQDAYIAEHDMVVIDGYIGNDPEMRTRGASRDGEALREHRGDAAEALLRAQRRRGARGPGDLHAGPRRRGLPRRPRDRGGSRRTTRRASSTPTTSVSRRRAACGCGTTSSTARAASPCTPGSR